MGLAENRDFSRGPRFFGPIKWHEAPAECHFGAQKIVRGPKRRQVYSTGALIVKTEWPLADANLNYLAC